MSGNVKVSIITMGCKVNKADSASMAALAKSMGFEVAVAGHEADIFILNTCTVTAKSDAETRQILRRLHKVNPDARVFLTGCLARVKSELDAEFRSYCVVVNNLDPAAIKKVLNEVAGTSFGESLNTCNEADTQLLADFSDRTRPFVKVQDGCSSCCTYCIVPAARGQSRSVPLDAAKEMVKGYLDAGRRELVLTGVHLGAYGRDLGIQEGLAHLIESLAPEFDAHPGSRVRLSSLEPLELTDTLINVIANTPFVCRHLHIPLQSGSDRVLEMMKRPYTASMYADSTGRAATLIEGVLIGADVICGFPGETDEDHQLTIKLVNDSPINYLHAFTFSPRPGTPAASMKDLVQAPKVKKRVFELRSLGELKRSAFTATLEGTVQRAIIEREKPGGVFTGLTDNYIRVPVVGRGLKAGAIAKIMIGRDAWGRFMGSALSVEGGIVEEGYDAGGADKTQELRKRLGYDFKDLELFSRALVHRSVVNERNLDRTDSNERLEFLGDAVLSLAITTEIVTLLPDAMEGALSRVRASLVNEHTLADRARELELGPCLALGRGEEASGGSEKPSILADAFEAVVGAVYLDGGFEAARKVVQLLFKDLLEEVTTLQDGRDFKTKLQELVQQELHSTPAYHIVSETGPDHDKVFETEVRVGGKPFGSGKGRSKREAEQEAAKEAEAAIAASLGGGDEGS